MSRKRSYKYFNGKGVKVSGYVHPLTYKEAPRDAQQPYVEGKGDYVVRDSTGTASKRMDREFAFNLARKQTGLSYVIHVCANRLVGTVPFDRNF